MSFGHLSNCKDVTLSDSVDVGVQVLAFTCNVGGTLSFLDMFGNTHSMVVTAGVVYPFSIKRFRVTGTTGVTGVLAWY